MACWSAAWLGHSYFQIVAYQRKNEYEKLKSLHQNALSCGCFN